MTSRFIPPLAALLLLWPVMDARGVDSDPADVGASRGQVLPAQVLGDEAFASREAVATAPAEAGIRGAVRHAREVAGLLVWIDHVDGEFPPPDEPAVMDQKQMRFVPDLLPILVGTTVVFLNSDPGINHNVFSRDGERYNLGVWSAGEQRSYTFNHVGVYRQLCALHLEMQAAVVVLQNPYYAVTGDDGGFHIPGVPDGTYTMKLWGARLRRHELGRTFEVAVRGGRAEVVIEL